MELESNTAESPSFLPSSVGEQEFLAALTNAKKLKIYTYPHPFLQQIARSVEKVNEEIRDLCLNMVQTMYLSNGIGLAAPQVGSSLRIFVLDVQYQRKKILDAEGNERFLLSDHGPQVFINPVIREKKGEICFQEGCLSLPGIFEDVQRFQEIVVDYLDINGQKQSLTTTDLLSICIQHENDHLDGVVFLDRLGAIKKNLLQKKILKQKKQKIKAAK